MNIMALKVGKSDAKTFFEAACASFLATNPERSKAVGGSVAFHLRGVSLLQQFLSTFDGIE